MSLVDRAFVRLAEGLVHYRHAGDGGVPLYMAHSGPGSSHGLAPLVAAFGFQPPGTRRTDGARVAAMRAALDRMG